MKKNTLIKKLKAIEAENDLEKYVIDDILNEDEPQQYIEDVLKHGCISGMVNGLVYYNETKEFYIEYIDDIEELKEEMEEQLGEPLKIGTPMYNWLAWFGYEQTLYKLADKLGLND